MPTMSMDILQKNCPKLKEEPSFLKQADNKEQEFKTIYKRCKSQQHRAFVIELSNALEGNNPTSKSKIVVLGEFEENEKRRQYTTMNRK